MNGYGNRSAKGKENAKKERLWFSPGCAAAATLFDNATLFAQEEEG